MRKNIINYITSFSNNKKTQELLFETIGRILLKQNNIEQYIKENEDKIIHIRDWIFSVVENNEQWKKPRVLTIEALNNVADKYFQKKNNKLKIIELDEEHEKLIADLDDYYIIQMLTPEALDNESKVMQHCIGHGGYDKKLDNENYQYLSLRNKFNKAHITLEISEKNILQIQGKQNKLPDKKYLEKLLPWLNKNNYKLDLNKYDLVFNTNDKKIYSIYNIPDNCEIDGDLKLKSIKIKKLPNNLIVNGNLDLQESSINILSNNITINGNLELGYTKIKEIPECIKINGDLNLQYSKIEKLPNNLTINGNLNLYNNKSLKKLPNNLIIKGDLNLNCSNIEYLPEDIQINENLYLFDSKIIKLPNNLKIRKKLVISWCKNLKELPDNINIKVIQITDKQIHLIKNNMNIDYISIYFNTFNKEEFLNKKEDVKYLLNPNNKF